MVEEEEGCRGCVVLEEVEEFGEADSTSWWRREGLRDRKCMFR